jgi:acetyl/propionyl-CoA carboxylase alpha subunit
MKVLVANRGEIACRILRTLKEMRIPSVAVHTEVDRKAAHVALADEAVALGAPGRYLEIAAILEAARATGATAIHPGYGFLSQNPEFARRCASSGLVFIGPTPEAIVALGDKRGARRTAAGLGIPVVPGAEDADTLDTARGIAGRLGYPILLKAAAGGGGKGMRLVSGPADLDEAHAGARREALAAFGDGRLLLEKYLHPARHIEVQILGDGRDAVALGERECSLQRRYQKVIEESPAGSIPDGVRRALAEAAIRLARAVGYRSAGTVEFLVGPDGGHAFLEVNTRLQVEHPVTEMLTGLDLVRCQIELAEGGSLPGAPTPRGHAIEARLTAEDVRRGFLPVTGEVWSLRWPQIPGVRIDSGLREGTEVSRHYDSLLAKVIAWGGDREQARRRLVEALRESVIRGLTTNRLFLLAILEHELFMSGETFTTTLESTSWELAEEPEEVRPSVPGASSPEEDPWSPWRGTASSGPARSRGRARAGGPGAPGRVDREIRAPMTGKVVRVAVGPGTAVRRNDVLVVLEAMKMEYRLSAPRDGTVESVRCQEGELVDLDHLLVTLDP